MRVLYVINGFDPGGAEHGLLTLIEAGCFEGHDLRVLAFCRGRGKLADRVAQGVGADRIHFTTLRENLTIWAFMAGYCHLLMIAIRFRPSKMVLSLKQANIVGRLAAIFLPHVTCVAFEHTAQYRARRFDGVYAPLLRLLSWRVDEIWADCTETLAETRRYFRRKSRAEHVVPLFVADAIGPCKISYEIGSPLRLAAAGRLIAGKNVARMVEVVAILRGEGIEAKLDIFGDGPEYEALLTLITRCDLRSHVVLHGYRSDWIAQAAKADVVLNLSEREGFCIVVAEAMAAGLPVIAVDVGGVRDYGRDRENMLKLASPDLETARAAIRNLAEDKELRERLGRQARADMLRDYDATCMKRKMNHALTSSHDIPGIR
jgi:glycosyltransferase involved in cell wall biosynthesis